ncbi:efflux RND transporter periplasmic adaptor subunit [Flavobacterium agrisoli]|uniref:Efflux RND transporter periplasmic adaptor subunit n=1 Tax=Flavobacterium agrisoli TaxID=2793066 RepID=A0A934UIC8_9FLAO|nr:efflux RND transporter periplasmic adaptor subunit [Flavobacterium agrisoli]MBK0368716.1 efflux RND transporter periplasmic adaptor subunit [Flavobacterium agrisoli]
MKFKNLALVIIIIGIGSFIGYRIIANQEKNAEAKAFKSKKKATTVSGIIVKSSVFDNHLSLSGSIEANEQVEIRSEVSGIVEGIYFKEGSMVKKGQVLFKVNDIELKAQLQQAITKQGLAGENARRAKLLLEKEAISQEEFDVANADFASTTAQTQLIRAQIAKTSVKAPFSGKIGLRSISPGTYITPSLLVAKLVNTQQLKITFSVPEKYATQVQNHTKIQFTVSGSNEVHTATVYAIEPEVEVQTRTLQIRALANNVDGKLFPGTFADVQLPLTIIQDAIVIPTEAIIPIQGGKKVFVAKNGKAKEIKVETGTRTESDILIYSGLQVGDTLITNGVMSLKNDDSIQVTLE